MHASTPATSAPPCAVLTVPASSPATAQSMLGRSTRRSISAPTTTPPCTFAGESPLPILASEMADMYRNASA